MFSITVTVGCAVGLTSPAATRWRREKAWSDAAANASRTDELRVAVARGRTGCARTRAPRCELAYRAAGTRHIGIRQVTVLRRGRTARVHDWVAIDEWDVAHLRDRGAGRRRRCDRSGDTARVSRDAVAVRCTERKTPTPGGRRRIRVQANGARFAVVLLRDGAGNEFDVAGIERFLETGDLRAGCRPCRANRAFLVATAKIPALTDRVASSGHGASRCAERLHTVAELEPRPVLHAPAVGRQATAPAAAVDARVVVGAGVRGTAQQLAVRGVRLVAARARQGGDSGGRDERPERHLASSHRSRRNGPPISHSMRGQITTRALPSVGRPDDETPSRGRSRPISQCFGLFSPWRATWFRSSSYCSSRCQGTSA